MTTPRLILLVFLGHAMGCLSVGDAREDGGSVPADEPRGPSTSPDYPAFAGHVAPLLARRCGSLDCHGSTTRRLRIFSREGMRLGGAVPGGESTSEAELRATFEALVAVEPAALGRAVDSAGADADVNALLLVKKGLGVAHEGGRRFFEGDDPAVRCIAGWLHVPNAWAQMSARHAETCAAAASLDP